MCNFLISAFGACPPGRASARTGGSSPRANSWEKLCFPRTACPSWERGQAENLFNRSSAVRRLSAPASEIEASIHSLIFDFGSAPTLVAAT